MAYSGNSGLRRIFKATLYSWQGFKAAFIHEEAFRQEILVALCLIPLGFYLGQTGLERLLLTGSVIILLLVELLNSALETVVDRIGRERDDLSGRAKDMGSAAVFLSIVLIIMTWSMILIF